MEPSNKLNALRSLFSNKKLSTHTIIEKFDENEWLNPGLGINHLNHTQRLAGTGSWEYLIEQDRLICSDNYFTLMGLDKAENLTMDIPFETVHPEDFEITYNLVERACKGEGYTTEVRIFHGKTKELRYLLVSAEVVSTNGKPYKLIGTIKDTTFEKQLDNALAESRNDYQYIFDHLSSGIWVRESIQGKYIYASKGIEAILEIPKSQLFQDSNSWYNMIDPKYHKEFSEAVETLSQGKSVQAMYTITSGSGKTKKLLEQVVPWLNEEGQITGIFGLVSDVTYEMEIEEKLNYLADFDSLTGLPNQKSLYGKLDEYCSKEDAFAILYMDIDRFSLINNSLGYAIGDGALKLIAERFKKLTPEDGYISRLNSNDFVMITKGFQNKEEVYLLAEKVMETINEPFTIQGFELNISTSIGITFYPYEGQDKTVLLENAHSALLQAKKEGKDNYQLSSHVADISSFKKYILDRDMRKAIQNEEFELYFQPQVNPVKGAVCGAEALIRWNHKEWGVISPGEFLPLAEENYLIIAITDWVIEKVCSHLQEWKEKGLPIIPIAVNVPPIRFMKTGLVEFVKEQIARYQINPAFLEFEITESTLLKEDESAISVIDQLKNMGISIAIDDFGVGYASLDYIRKFKPDKIKIDRVFIQNINKEDGIENALISSTLHLGEALQMKVVAEGVEEFEQLNFLKQKQCDVVQGYIFSKPVEVGKFEGILKIGYLKPTKTRRKRDSVERRKFFRHEFQFPLPGEMTIVELNGRKVSVGTTPILIENISLGGVMIQSNLNLPVNKNMKFHLNFEIMNEKFEIDGELKWMEEDFKEKIFSYGVSFGLDRVTENRVAYLMNKLSTYRKKSEKIPDTTFIYEDARKFFGL